MTRYVIHNHLPARRAVDAKDVVGFVRGGPKRAPYPGHPMHEKSDRELHQIIARIEGQLNDKTKWEAAGLTNRQGKLDVHAAGALHNSLDKAKSILQWREDKAKSSDAKPKEGDPDYKAWLERQREEQNKRGGGFHNDAHDAELNYSMAMKGWMFRYEGKNYGPFEDEPKAKAKLASLKGSKDRDFRGVVNRDEEERNRDRMYKDAGITRV